MKPPADASPESPPLFAVAERLMQAKQACRTFLTLWAADRLAESDQAMSKLVDDLDRLLDIDVRRPNLQLLSDRILDD